MKLNKWTIILGWIFVCKIFSQQNVQNQFSEANEMYRQNDYKKAIEIYKSILEKGYENSELYYNLGNAYYKLNKPAPSIFYYEKALQINSTNEDAKINLQFAKKMCVDVIEPLPDGFWDGFMKKMMFYFSKDFLAINCVAFSFLFALFFGLFYFSRKRLFFGISLIALFLFLIGFLISLQQDFYQKNNKFAIVFAEKVNVQDAPNEHSSTVFELHEGTKVQILDAVADWKKIKIADGQVGWMDKKALKTLNKKIK